MLPHYHPPMKYRPDCLYFGLFISILGGLSFAVLWFLTEYFRAERLSQGYSVYVIPYRGDVAEDDLPVLPDLEAFEDEESNNDKGCEILADAENVATEEEENGNSAYAENNEEDDENI